jgi:hypothetical protein
MYASHWKGRVRYVCNTNNAKKNATDCRQWSFYEDELLPLVCQRLVQTVDEEVLKVIEAKPDGADLTDLDYMVQDIRAHEKALERATQNYLRADDDLQPVLQEEVRKMKRALSEAQERYQLLANQRSLGGLQHFVEWWRQVREKLVATSELNHFEVKEDGSLAPLERCGEDGKPDEEYLFLQGEGLDLLTTSGELRSLLHRLGFVVSCYFVPTGSKKRSAPGRGRGKSYALARVRLSLNTNDMVVHTNRHSRS